MTNRVIITTAGGGKTTKIVNEVLESKVNKTLITTFTQNNAEEIKKKFYRLNGRIPEGITINTWFSFLLKDIVRPYQNFLCTKRIDNINFVSGQSAKYVKKEDVKTYYFDKAHRVYTDKISEFGILCNTKSNGLVINRLQEVYENIYIDEVQDLAGYDLELLELLLNSSIKVTLVGDHRQATFQTNHGKKNKKYSGAKIINKFKEWEKKKLCSLDYDCISHRCNQAICDFSDLLLNSQEKTISKNNETTEHDGVFHICESDVDAYIDKFNPQLLRYNKQGKCYGYESNALNWGDSKGLTFDRVLIIPHGPLKKALASGNVNEISKSLAKIYVAITRARYSVAFVLDKKTTPAASFKLINFKSF